MEHCIVYFSTWMGPFQEADLIAALEQGRHNNAVDGITGVTLYVRGNIVQVLEGQKGVVEAIYHQIQQDQRHTNVILVLSRPIEHRLFPSNALGYETITTSQFDELKTVIDLSTREGASGNSKAPIILRLIKTFYDSNRFN